MTKVREGYKETEIGVIPEDWECLNLSKVSTLIDGDRGKNYPSPNELVDDGILFLSTSNIKDNKFDTSVTKFISQEKFDSLGKGKLEREDLIITLRGTLGSIMLFESDEFKTAFINAQMMIIRTNHLIDNRYLYQCMISNSIKSQIATNSTGSAQPQLTKKVVSELYIPVPHIKEQQRIAEILSTTDAHIEKLDKTIEDYQLLKKGMMKKLLTEGIGHTEFKETEIGRIPKAWEVVKQGEISTFYNGRAYKQTEFREFGTPIIRIQNLTGEGRYVYSDLELESEKYISKDDLIYAWSATFGPYIWNGPRGIYHYHIWKIGCSNRLDKKFFYYRLYQISDELSSKKNGSVFAHITKGFMENHKIALPSIEEQELIARIITNIDFSYELYVKEKEGFIQLKKALMEKLMTGKIRTTEINTQQS